MSFPLHNPWQMDGPTKGMIAEDALWGLRQAGRRLERYVEDFIEQIDFALAHLLLRTSTYRPNGSDRLPKPKTPPDSPELHLRPQPLAAVCGEVEPAIRGEIPAAVHGQRKPQASRRSRPTQAASQQPFAADASRQPAADRGRRKPQASRRSRLTEARDLRGRSRPPFAAYASLPAPAPELLDTALPPEFSAPLLPQSPPPRQRTPEPASRQRTQSPLLPSAPKCPRLPSAPKCPRLPSAPKCPRLPSAPRARSSPYFHQVNFFFLEGGSRAPAGEVGAGAAASEAVPPWPPESPDPPWPPELPASPWRSPVSPAWSSLQGEHPPSPLDMLRCGTHLLGGGDNVRILDC